MRFVAHKDLDALLLKAVHQGCTVQTRAKSIAIRRPGYCGVVWCAKTASDVRAHLNVRQMLRARLGVEV